MKAEGVGGGSRSDEGEGKVGEWEGVRSGEVRGVGRREKKWGGERRSGEVRGIVGRWKEK